MPIEMAWGILIYTGVVIAGSVFNWTRNGPTSDYDHGVGGRVVSAIFSFVGASTGLVFVVMILALIVKAAMTVLAP